jgi:hypothetical protein
VLTAPGGYTDVGHFVAIRRRPSLDKQEI